MKASPIGPPDTGFLREALRLAAENSASGVNGPFGAVVVREGAVVGRGWNRVVEDADPTAHAEILAIRDAARELGTHVLADCVLYASCQPCPMCMAAVYWARIGRVIYAAGAEDAAQAGFDDSAIAGDLARPLGEREVEEVQALREEGREVLRAWVRNPSRIPY